MAGLASFIGQRQDEKTVGAQDREQHPLGPPTHVQGGGAEQAHRIEPGREDSAHACR